MAIHARPSPSATTHVPLAANPPSPSWASGNLSAGTRSHVAPPSMVMSRNGTPSTASPYASPRFTSQKSMQSRNASEVIGHVLQRPVAATIIRTVDPRQLATARTHQVCGPLVERSDVPELEPFGVRHHRGGPRTATVRGARVRGSVPADPHDVVVHGAHGLEKRVGPRRLLAQHEPPDRLGQAVRGGRIRTASGLKDEQPYNESAAHESSQPGVELAARHRGRLRNEPRTRSLISHKLPQTLLPPTL